MKTFVVMWKDSAGNPRAWGKAATEELAIVEAGEQFACYRESHPDFKSMGPWTRETKTIDNAAPASTVLRP